MEKIDDYALFVSIVRAGSLTAAGREAGLSVAAVSKRLGQLEARLGGQLLARSTRRLALTETGRQFFEKVAPALDTISAAEGEVAGHSAKPSGRLRVTAPTSFGRMHVAPHVEAFLTRYPGIRLELVLDDAYSDLIANRLDLAIRIAGAIEAGAHAHFLCRNHRVLCASPKYLTLHGAPERLADLRRHVLLAAQHQTPWRLQAQGKLEHVRVDSLVATNSSEVVRELCLAGAGIALRSTWDVGRDLRAGRLQRVLPRWSGATDVGVYAVHPPTSNASASVRALIEYLRGLYEHPPWEKSAKSRK